jgi:hypothetical protein
MNNHLPDVGPAIDRVQAAFLCLRETDNNADAGDAKEGLCINFQTRLHLHYAVLTLQYLSHTQLPFRGATQSFSALRHLETGQVEPHSPYHLVPPPWNVVVPAVQTMCRPKLCFSHSIAASPPKMSWGPRSDTLAISRMTRCGIKNKLKYAYHHKDEKVFGSFHAVFCSPADYASFAKGHLDPPQYRG